MKGRALRVRRAALEDLLERERGLAHARGVAFARQATDELLNWLEKIAAMGVQLGTEHGVREGMRTFGYRRQATILVRYTRSEMQVVRIYVRGQDWWR